MPDFFFLIFWLVDADFNSEKMVVETTQVLGSGIGLIVKTENESWKLKDFGLLYESGGLEGDGQ